MDDNQALRIVTALANGAHPSTGEVFSPDSPYQSPEVIRALFAAVRALDMRANSVHSSGLASGQSSRQFSGQSSGQSSGQPSGQSSAQAATRPPQSARNPAAGNAGKPWSAEEDRQLLAAFDAGKSLTDIAQSHSRTQGGVRARLEKHGRLEPSPASRWPASGTSRQGEQVRDATL